MRFTKDSIKADGLLLLVAIIWGFAFVAQRSGMAVIGPYAFNGVRFALGALCLEVYYRYLPLYTHVGGGGWGRD